MRDFTVGIFKELLNAILNGGYKIITFQQYAENKIPAGRFVILRHDIDKKPLNALRLAQIENSFSINSSFYIRDTPEVLKSEIILKIAAMGHEIGYHYEDFYRSGGNREQAFKSFEISLKKIRQLYPVKTICMHGNPLSMIDNKQLWQTRNFNQYGILAEVYLDTDFNEIFYLTDSSRTWNSKANIRDKVQGSHNIPIKNTWHLIESFNKKTLPDKIMINIHPQRWEDNYFFWTTELFKQNFKNIFKYLLLQLGGYR